MSKDAVLQKVFYRNNEHNEFERVIDVLKLLDKRGLSYRAKCNEAVHTLANPELDHGNFSDILLLLGKYDHILQNHLNECVARLREKKLSKSSSNAAHGGFITLLLQTTADRVIECLGKIIQVKEVREIKEAGICSIQLDTSQDISGLDQCSVIVRYVSPQKIIERLLCVLNCKDSTGKGLKDLIHDNVRSLGLHIEVECIGASIDGDANMIGQSNGFNALMSMELPEYLHIWCYAHNLNLVMVEATSCTISSASSFSILNKTAVLVKESYKRVDVYISLLDPNDKRRLNLIGETRWWAKHSA
ncbi:hypothetical protein QAD02_020875, partial [Eretmocerus hayati]